MVAARHLNAVVAELCEIVRTSYGVTPIKVKVYVVEDGKHVILPCPPANGVSPAAEVGSEPFVPTPYQEAILVALEGKALRTDALANVVGDRSRLFRHPGGLRELQAHGLVAHHKRLGFYRPDVPPEALESGIDQSAH